jgi:hypothetical protein
MAASGRTCRSGRPPDLLVSLSITPLCFAPNI